MAVDWAVVYSVVDKFSSFTVKQYVSTGRSVHVVKKCQSKFVSTVPGRVRVG